ncbi:MAG: CIA30 family protein [Phormidesmis sp.]
MTSKNQSEWNAGRFFTTLNYFGEIPFIGSFRWAQQLLGQSPTVPGSKVSVLKRQVAVIGNSPALRFDPFFDSIQARLAPSMDVVFYPLTLGDRTAPATLNDGLRQLVQSVDSVIVLDTPSAPASLLADIAAYLGENPEIARRCIFDFSDPNIDLSAWGALDDVVMGGVSEGKISLQAQASAAVFSGYVSTDNSGGFSSVRTRNFEPPFDFSGWSGMRLRVKGDGQRYKFIARNREGWDSSAYIYSFDTVADDWCDINVPFDEMAATFRAKSVADAPAFDPSKVVSLQLMLSKFESDGRLNPHFMPGPFQLAVSGISVYRPRQGLPLIVVSQQDEVGQEQATLNESMVNYRWIDANAVNVIEAIAAMLEKHKHMNEKP